MVALLILSATSLAAQSIAPPIAEFRGNKVDGMVEVQNAADYPMAVPIKTKSFVVGGRGEVHYLSLDKNLEVSLGASSFIIRPHDSRIVFYKATATDYPAAFRSSRP
jgi:hypothetical protein